MATKYCTLGSDMACLRRGRGPLSSLRKDCAALAYAIYFDGEFGREYSIAFHAEDFGQILYAGDHGLVGLRLGA